MHSLLRQLWEFVAYYGLVLSWACRQWWKHFSQLLIASGVVAAISLGIGIYFHSQVIARSPALREIAGQPMSEVVVYLCYGIIPAVLIGLVVFVILCIAAPSQIHLEQSDELKSLRMVPKLPKGSLRLDAVNCQQGHGQPAITHGAPNRPGDLGIRLHFTNISDHLLSYSVERLSATLPDIHREESAETKWTALVPPHSVTIASLAVPNIDWSGLSRVHFIVSYDIRYNTDPPTIPRRTARTVKVDIPTVGLNQTINSAYTGIEHIEE